MKVKCMYNKIKNNDKIYSNLTVNKEYIVLAIEFYDKEIAYSDDYILYRIEDDEGLIKLLSSKLFTITSSHLSTCWVSFEKSEYFYSILPREWANLYFWDDFYNDEPNALETFKRVKKQIYEEESNINYY